jgi:aromatic-amino-acid transaminase
MFESLVEQPADALLALIGLYKNDPRADKLDLGVGVYRDETGATPIMQAVKAAEKHLLETRTTKAYLGPDGDPVYTELLKPIVFGSNPGPRLVGIQSPGGTGALRLAADLIVASKPDAKLLYGQPTWVNHLQIAQATRLASVPHPFFDINTQSINFGNLIAAIEGARAGDVVLLHGCCHNPTGTDLNDGQWAEIATLLARTGVIPLIDLAYQGLGRGFEADAAGTRKVVGAVEEAIVAYSVDKNFGLYRERVGALYVKTRDEKTAGKVLSNLTSLTRVNWSMPPDHGAAIVRTILESPELTAVWRAEIDRMGDRVRAVRAGLAAAEPALAYMAEQHGMFSMLKLTADQIGRLRADHGVYMAGSGRINVAGLQVADIPAFVRKLRAVGFGNAA